MDTLGDNAETQETVDFGDHLRVIRERKWIVLLCIVVVTAAAVGASLRTVPLYRATATVEREGTTLAEAILGARVEDSQIPERVQKMLQTSADSVTIEATAQRVREELKSARSAEQLAAMVRALPSTNADTLLISATSEYPQEAADVATAFARGFVASELEKKKASIRLARSVVEGQLKTMTATEIASPRGALLSERAEQLGIVEQLQIGDYALSRSAAVPRAPFKPHPLRSALLGLVAGLVLGVSLAFLLEYLDRRIKDEQTMEKEFGVAVLATVPMVDGGWRAGRSDLPIGFADKHSPIIESFRTLRSNLQYFGVDKELRTILVTSALPREGKSTVSINLGLGLALSGARVILLEADLRRPMLHAYLKLGNEIGVSNVLAGTHSFTESLQLVRVDDYMPEGTRTEIPSGAEDLLLQKNLYCITSGPLPPNPSELMGSAKMQQLLKTAAEAADYVIVDAPPLLVAADPLSLAAQVDGVLLTALLFSTTRDEAKAARELLHRAGAHVIGAVALGGKPSSSYYHRDYDKGYGSSG